MVRRENDDRHRRLGGQASLFLDKEGRWFHEGEEITHSKTALLFSRSLQKGSNGSYFVQVGKERAPVELEDAPFVVKSVTVGRDDQGVACSYLLLLNDRTEEPLDPHTLFVQRDHVMYCWVKDGAHRARFLRSAYYQLCEFIGCDSNATHFWIPWKEEQVRIQMER